MTHYERLGVARDADTATIRKRYRKLALTCHPDVCKDKDAEERFKLLGEAHDTLANANKRYFYDMTLNPLPSVFGSSPDSLFSDADTVTFVDVATGATIRFKYGVTIHRQG